MAGHRAALERLPDDILFLILDNLETARDQACLSRTCRTLYQFMQSEGWRAFSRRCSPGVFATDHRSRTAGGSVESSNGVGGGSRNSSHKSQIDANIGNGDDDGTPGWNALANSLTWQSRAWDRRALAFQAMLPRWDHVPRHKRPRPYRPSLAVHFQADLAEGGKRLGLGVDGEELLVCGAGEDIVARFRKRGRGGRQEKADDAAVSSPVWRVFNGQAAGFRPGFDDVRAVSVVENAMGQPRRRGILAGRDNGDVSLLSAEPDKTFGRPLARFVPRDDAAVDQSRIYGVDVSMNGRNAAALGSDSRAGLAAVTTPSDILFYPMPQSSPAESDGGRHEPGAVATTIHPVATFPMGDIGLYHNGIRQPYNARWMEAEGHLAVAMGAGPTPLRYLTMTPTGAVELTTAYRMPELMEHYHLRDTTLLIPTALEPVPPSSITGGNGHLVLTGWRDGTCRLQDLRTASPWDLIYQDNVMGSQDCAQALLIWGADRFVTGNQESAGLKIFDLRWPRLYCHTEALPCTSSLPYPVPPVPMGAPGSMGMGDLIASLPGTASRMKPRSGSFFVPPSSRTAENWPPAAPQLPLHLQATDRCNVLQSVRCRWHAASRDLFYRSSSSLFLQRSLDDHGIKATGVFALACASSTDLAPANFYAGLNNCVVESFLYEDVVPIEAPPPFVNPQGSPAAAPLSSIWTEGGSAPYFGYPKTTTTPMADTGSGVGGAGGGDGDGDYYRTVDLDVAVMETGDSMARVNIEDKPMWLPRIRNRRYDFNPIPLDTLQKEAKEARQGRWTNGSARGNGSSGRPNGTSRANDWNYSNGGSGPSLDKFSLVSRQRHRLDYGIQDDADFEDQL